MFRETCRPVGWGSRMRRYPRTESLALFWRDSSRSTLTDSNKEMPFGTRHACFVQKGFLQGTGVDFGDTYAPVAQGSTLRAVLALAANRGCELCQLDVKAASLQSNVKETIYVEQPEGFLKHGRDDEELVCSLHRALSASVNLLERRMERSTSG